jgi:hypothetical protein
MTELERVKNIEEHITLAGLLPGVNLDCLPPKESAKLKRAALDLYRLGHASGFKAGADYAVAGATQQWRNAIQMQRLMRRLSAHLCGRWREFKPSLRSIRATVIRIPLPRRFPS